MYSLLPLVLLSTITAADPAAPLAVDGSAVMPNGEFIEVFEQQLNRMLAEYWQEDGDWVGDMMNDATAFAPELLFELHQVTGDQRFYDRAVATCRYQLRMFNKVAAGEATFDINSIAGVSCFLTYMRYAPHEPDCSNYRTAIATVINGAGLSMQIGAVQSLIPDAEKLRDIGLPLDASMALQYHEIEPAPSMLTLGQMLIALHERDYLDPQTGVFRSPRYGDWGSALGLRAYADAFVVTADPSYRAKADTLIDHLRTYDWTFDRIFFNPPRHRERRSEWSVYLSSLLLFIDDFNRLYDATGDPQYHDCARRGLTFITKQMILSDVYPEGTEDMWFDDSIRVVPFAAHDLGARAGRKYVKPIYCAGCQWYLMSAIWDFNHPPSNLPAEGSDSSGD